MTETDRTNTVILVVDDEVVVRNFISNLLQRDGYSVVAAAHGQEALDVIRDAGDIGLVITDVRMPQMTGLELIEYLLKEKPQLKTLVISARASDAARGSNLGVPFLLKPFDSAALRSKVEEVLERN